MERSFSAPMRLKTQLRYMMVHAEEAGRIIALVSRAQNNANTDQKDSFARLVHISYPDPKYVSIILHAILLTCSWVWVRDYSSAHLSSALL